MNKQAEEVIKGLEVCKTAPESIEECEGCPYNDGEDDCITRMAEDALEMLKAQKPRVMKPEEIKPADDGGRMYWLEVSEIHGHSACFPVLPIEQKANGVLEFAAIFNNGYGPVTVGRFNPDKYNTVWRCWTEKPTEEQRKAVKWDE